jgi:hypothetical protein
MAYFLLSVDKTSLNLYDFLKWHPAPCTFIATHIAKSSVKDWIGWKAK